MSLGGHKVEPVPVRVRWEPVKIGLLTLVLVWAGKRLGRLAWAVLRTPALLVALTVAVLSVAVWVQLGPWVDIAALVLAAVGLVVWWRRWPDGFERWVWLRWRAGWRRFFIYRHRWPASMDTAGLNAHRDGTEHLPTLGRVTSTRGMDRVRVRMLPGQTHADWAKVADRLRQTFGALDCRVRTVPGRVHDLELWFLTVDPLIEPVRPRARGVTRAVVWSPGRAP